MDQSLFQFKKKDKRQERARLLIVEAFNEVKNNPLPYDAGGAFEILMPEKDWYIKSVEEFE